MPITNAEKQANYKARMEKAGLVRHQHVWAHPEDWPKIKALIDERKKYRLREMALDELSELSQELGFY